MDEVKEFKEMKISQLAQHLMRFRDDHDRRSNPELRWLASKVDDLLNLICAVDDGDLSPEMRKEIKEFEAGIIELEIEGKRREIAQLEANLQKARAA